MDNLLPAIDRLARQGPEAEAILAAAPAWIEMLPMGIYACDASGRVCWFNRRAAELWGRSPALSDDAERYCGSFRLFSLDTGALIRRDETPMAQALRTGLTIEAAEAMVERPDGSRIVAMVHINPVKDAAGSTIGAINCFHEITQIREENRELRESERQIRELLDALPAAVYTTDAKGRITYYNEAAVALAGRRPQLGSDEWCVTWRLLSPDGAHLPHDQCPMAVALKEDRPVRGVEAIAERPDGTRVPFIPYPTPLHNAAGELIGAVNMLVDISQRKEAETQQRILFSELNHRTKNNMQTLHALLNAARRDTPSAEAKVVLGEAIRRVGAMAAAQTVLYLANNAQGYQASDFLQAVGESAQQGLAAGVTIRYAAADAELSNDTAAPLALILNELITNAAKHGGNGRSGVAIEITLVRDPDEFVLCVRDDGPGFDLNETAPRSSGLSLVRGLVGQIGGSFSVEGASGARCAVRFPDHRACH